MHIIPNTIHFIWLGSFITSAHQLRIQDWRQLNPHFKIKLWISKSIVSNDIYEMFDCYCKSNNISLKNIDDINVGAENVNAWLRNSLTRGLRNYGALSDIYRFYILQKGGWYFDCDVTPKKALPLDLESRYGFILNASYYKNEGVVVFPDQLAVAATTNFISMSTQIIESLIQLNHGIELDEFVHSSDPSQCWMGTENTTGLIACRAARQLLSETNTSMISLKPLHIEPSITFNHVLGRDNSHFETIKRDLSWVKNRFPNRGLLQLVANEQYFKRIQHWFELKIKDIEPEKIQEPQIIEYIPIQLFFFWTSLRQIATEVQAVKKQFS